MKNKLLLTILTAIFISQTFADNFNKKGLIHSWKFSPLQVGVGIFDSANLLDADSIALFSFGFAGIQQHSSIISFGGITKLKNNYGIQVSAASLTDRNYGLMIGLLENCTDVNKNYGVKIGVFNVSGMFYKGQFAGIDFCDYLHIGIINYHAPLQFGVVNISEESLFQIGLFNAGTNKIEKNFQIGLLNYNPKSYIPWMPIVNWDMGREEK